MRESGPKGPGAYPTFRNSMSVFLRFREEFARFDREHFCVVALDMKNRMIAFHTVSIGSLNISIVHPREVFKPLILDSAASFFALHNHPSGDPTPSREDRDCTARIVAAGKIIGIKMIDHIVLGEEDYFSFADAGILDEERGLDKKGKVAEGGGPGPGKDALFVVVVQNPCGKRANPVNHRSRFVVLARNAAEATEKLRKHTDAPVYCVARAADDVVCMLA